MKLQTIYLRKKVLMLLVLFVCTVAVSSLQLFANVKTETSEEVQNRDAINFAYFLQKNFSTGKLIFADHPLIEKFKRQYLSPEGRMYLSEVMKRSVLYRDFILEQLEANSMPNELLFLPVIESGFNANAVSKSGAVGIWQFMRNSIAGYGIGVSEWVDERRDPWKTSIAAIKKLKYNYDELGDWCLALAAYNSGLNGIKNAMKRAGSNDFWYLLDNGYLKTETALYVPKFLAVTEILLRSDEFGIDWGDREQVLTTATVKVERTVDINFIEKELSIKEGLLQFLNPSLNYSLTPPNQPYDLRIPSEEFQRANTLLKSGKILVQYYVYVVKSGDTLYALSRHYGVSVENIQSYNKGLKVNSLQIGQKIMIPAIKKVSPYQGRRQEAYAFTGQYSVREGDTLWSIALAHDTTVEALAQKNNLEATAVLKVGRVLLVPGK